MHTYLFLCTKMIKHVECACLFWFTHERNAADAVICATWSAVHWARHRVKLDLKLPISKREDVQLRPRISSWDRTF